jgi:hypothetical protein
MPKNFLRLLGTLACVAFVYPAIGSQVVSQVDLEACFGLPGEDMQLACYRALTVRSRTLTAVPSAPVPSELADNLPTDNLPTDNLPTDNLPTDNVPANNAPALVSAPVARAPGLPATPPQIDDGFGKEYLDSDSDEPEQANRTATIVNVEKHSHGTLYFYMDNGQIWRQIEPRFFPYPKNTAFQVEIDQGVMGDYRLQVEGKGQKTRIRRVK